MQILESNINKAADFVSAASKAAAGSGPFPAAVRSPLILTDHAAS